MTPASSPPPCCRCATGPQEATDLNGPFVAVWSASACSATKSRFSSAHTTRICSARAVVNCSCCAKTTKNSCSSGATIRSQWISWQARAKAISCCSELSSGAALAIRPATREGLDGGGLQHPAAQLLPSPGRPLKVPHDAPRLEVSDQSGTLWSFDTSASFAPGVLSHLGCGRDESTRATDPVARSGGCLHGIPGAGGGFTSRFVSGWGRRTPASLSLIHI